MPDVVFAIPGDIDTPTGGYAYDRRLLAELPAAGVPASHLALPGGFPFASVPELGEAGYLLRQTPSDAVVMVDGLAFGALTDLVLKDIDRRFVALVHHPLALETGLNDRQRRALAASETSALARAVAVVVTSPLTAAILAADYGVPAARITVAEPGTDPAPRAAGSGGTVPTLIAVGSISRRKAYGVLVEALAGLADRPWRLRIVGPDDRDPDEAARLRALVAGHGLSGRIAIEGALDAAALDAAYAEADLFVMSSLFEGYGMVLAEALARGLPIVCTTGGAAAQTVPDGAGLKVPPGDVPALRDAIAAALDDPARRAALADASWAAGRSLPSWSRTAATVANVLKAAGA
ncbi:MAG: glycosyltransferase family 4 protein [Burkholderiales bacterium]|nr:glycosyltransferase family 4 protein [Burkholderiales bacterium]